MSPIQEVVKRLRDAAAFPCWDGLEAEAADLIESLLAAIENIDAHATPYGDIPDEPGWAGSYIVTAGALHKALGKLGHSAPSCKAEAELRAFRHTAAIGEGIWVHCTPELINAGIVCGETIRKPCACHLVYIGADHDHMVAPVADLMAAAPNQQRVGEE
jgi:hypothetical protein